MKYYRLTIFTFLMLLVTFSLFTLAQEPLFNFSFFDKAIINHYFNYQLSGLFLASFTLIWIYMYADKVKLSYSNFNRKGKMKPSPLFPAENDARWENDALYYALIMVALIAVVTFFQTYSVGFDFNLVSILMVFPLAASNAFVEEVIFRLSYVTLGNNETNSSSYGLIMGSVVFGIFKYSRLAPNGIVGVLIYTYLGYFLAKSIQETKGFYWAFMIHFMLDVIVLLFIFNLAS